MSPAGEANTRVSRATTREAAESGPGHDQGLPLHEHPFSFRPQDIQNLSSRDVSMGPSQTTQDILSSILPIKSSDEQSHPALDWISNSEITC